MVVRALALIGADLRPWWIASRLGEPSVGLENKSPEGVHFYDEVLKPLFLQFRCVLEDTTIPVAPKLVGRVGEL